MCRSIEYIRAGPDEKIFRQSLQGQVHSVGNYRSAFVQPIKQYKSRSVIFLKCHTIESTELDSALPLVKALINVRTRKLCLHNLFIARTLPASVPHF